MDGHTPIGVHHWRFPIILIELLPQPFPPTDSSFSVQIPTNYRDRLYQQEGIKDYTKQKLVFTRLLSLCLGISYIGKHYHGFTKVRKVTQI
jgi:hypothetical protein